LTYGLESIKELIVYNFKILKLVLISICMTPAFISLAKDNEAVRQEAHFALEKGLKAFKAKKLRKGIFHYERAYRLIPDNHTLFTIASAYQKLPNACQKSLQSWERLMMRCKGCDLKPKIRSGYLATQKKCNVKLSVATPENGIQVIINDELYGQAPISVLLPASRYQLELQKGSKVLYKGKVRLKENSGRKNLQFTQGEKGYQLGNSAKKSKEKLLSRRKSKANKKATKAKKTKVALKSKSSKKKAKSKNTHVASTSNLKNSKPNTSPNKSTKVTKEEPPTEIASAPKGSTSAGKNTNKVDQKKIDKEDHQMELKSSSKAIVINASLQCQFKSKQTNQYLLYPDCNGAALKEGDRFRVILSSPDESYVYMFLSNDNGDRVMLFPDPGVVNKLQGNIEYVIPGEDWYELDENGGVKEQIRLIASRDPITALEESRGLSLNTKALQTIKEMSFRGVRKTRRPARASVRLQQLDTIINSTGNDLSASVSFEIDHK
jgi:hypothetical protein